MSEEKASEQSVPAATIRRLFAPVDELEWVEVPGWEQVAFGIRRMDKHSIDRYADSGMRIHFVNGKARQEPDPQVEMCVADQNLQLVLDCVMDWRGLTIEKPARNAPGETVTEELRPPKVGKGVDPDRARRAMLRSLYCGSGEFGVRFEPELLEWLIEQCRRVNGMTTDLGNSSPSSSDS